MLDMNKVILELIAHSVTICPSKNNVVGCFLSVKYSVLHKIALTNWMPSLPKTYVTKDMAILLFFNWYR